MTIRARVLTSVMAAALGLTAIVPAAADQCCTLQKESFDNYPLFPNWGVGNTVVRAQSFTPQETYELCGVSLVMSNGGSATLYVQDDPTANPTTIYASGTATASTSDGWVFFDTEPDITTAPDEMLYLRLNNSTAFWRKYEDQSAPHWDAYPRGQAFEDGTACDSYDPDGDFHDFWFITHTWEECPPEGDVRIYLEADPNNHVHEIHPETGMTFDVYVCLDFFAPGQGTRGTAFLLVRTFGGYKLAQTSLLGGLDFGDAEVDPGWTIAAGADCAYPDAGGVVCVGRVTYLYMGAPGTLDILPSGLNVPGTGREVLDCEFHSMYYCIHANLGVSMPPNPGEPNCECEPNPVENTSWGGIKALFR